MSTLLLFAQAAPYLHRLLATRPQAYWPLYEAAGTTATCLANANQNGTHSNVTLGRPGIGDGVTCPYYNGTNSFTNTYSNTLRDAFSAAAGSVALWARVAAGAFTDGIAHALFNIQVDANNYLYIRAPVSDNQLLYAYRAGGGSVKSVTHFTRTLNWFHVAMTWSVAANALICYFNGAPTGSPQTSLGTWAGTLTDLRQCIGAATTTPTLSWLGNIAHVGLWTRALTPAEVAALAVIR
jgi:hypothetical protein